MEKCVMCLYVWNNMDILCLFSLERLLFTTPLKWLLLLESRSDLIFINNGHEILRSIWLFFLHFQMSTLHKSLFVSLKFFKMLVELEIFHKFKSFEIFIFTFEFNISYQIYKKKTNKKNILRCKIFEKFVYLFLIQYTHNLMNIRRFLICVYFYFIH